MNTKADYLRMVPILHTRNAPANRTGAKRNRARKDVATVQTTETLLAATLAGPRHEHLCGLWGK